MTPKDQDADRRALAKLWGDFVHHWRRERGLQQNELAALCGWKDTRISDFENGKSVPQLPSLVILAGALGIPSAPLGRLVAEMGRVLRPEQVGGGNDSRAAGVAQAAGREWLGHEVAEPRTPYGDPDPRERSLTDQIGRLADLTTELTWKEIDRRIDERLGDALGRGTRETRRSGGEG
jgi:transcriptional regulator with XRE-family HTH domain